MSPPSKGEKVNSGQRTKAKIGMHPSPKEPDGRSLEGRAHRTARSVRKNSYKSSERFSKVTTLSNEANTDIQAPCLERHARKT